MRLQVNDILEHYGVKGQRWGITRKGTRSSVHERRAINKASKQRAKSWKTVYKNRGKLSDTDLKNSVNRLRMENELGRLATEANKSSTSQRGKEAVSKWGSSVITSVQSQATQLAVQAAMSAAKSKIKHSNERGSEYMIYVDDVRGETIYHHGIKGQRWGVKKRAQKLGKKMDSLNSQSKGLKSTQSTSNMTKKEYKQTAKNNLKRAKTQDKINSIQGKNHNANIITAKYGIAVSLLATPVAGLAAAGIANHVQKKSRVNKLANEYDSGLKKR